MRLRNDLSTCTLRVGKIVFSLRRVSIGLHGALSLFNARTYSSVTLPLYCKKTRCLGSSSSSDWASLISGGAYSLSIADLIRSYQFLPRRLLIMELKRSGCYKSYLQYFRAICRLESCTLRLKFLETCLKSDIIPKFLKFCIPNNGCFDARSVNDFQRRLFPLSFTCSMMLQ